MCIQKELSEQDTVAIIQEEEDWSNSNWTFTTDRWTLTLQTHLYLAGVSYSSVSLFILSERSALTQVKQQEKSSGLGQKTEFMLKIERS